MHHHPDKRLKLLSGTISGQNDSGEGAEATRSCVGYTVLEWKLGVVLQAKHGVTDHWLDETGHSGGGVERGGGTHWAVDDGKLMIRFFTIDHASSLLLTVLSE